MQMGAGRRSRTGTGSERLEPSCSAPPTSTPLSMVAIASPETAGKRKA